ncbi:MAG TPA: BTAD domain-containing putative transcriptional regulator [Thermoanaerobaculia bacterium]|nr:BTAD domain-containing putative transcriptional regulator [Thermoanaerobaculia bacterium]
MSRLDLSLLGGFKAALDGEELQFATRKSEALLAYLAMPPGQMHPREKLAVLLWGDSGEEQARQSLRQTLFTLRKSVNIRNEIVLSGEGDRIGLDRSFVHVDVARFLELSARGTPEALAEAAELYRGEFLEGLSVSEAGFEDWVAIERDKLRETALSVLSTTVEQQMNTGKSEAAVQTSLRILAIDPLRESTHRLLMRLYVLQGRRESAIKQFQTCREILRRQLDVDPEDETKRLFEEILDATGKSTRDDGRIRVLMVEDNELNRHLVLSMLDEKKFDIAIAEDGGRALLQLGSRPFDLVLLDIMLPNVDGLTLLKVIRENGYAVPTILMTAMPGPEPEIEGLSLGATDFVRKPLQKSVLLARIENALKGRRTTA